MILSLLLALSQPAAAIDVKWWGVGPTVGTMAIPANYPIAFPANAKDAAGTPVVQKVKGDVSLGARGVLYPSANGRFGARGLFNIGTSPVATKQWTAWQLTLEYDHAIVKENGFQLLLGAGIGAGTERFNGIAGYEEGYLVTNYFPLRAQLTALLRDKTRAYEVDLYGAYHIAADQTYYDGPNDADPYTADEAALVAGAVYAKIGVEATVFFGDFKSQKGGGKKKRG